MSTLATVQSPPKSSGWRSATWDGYLQRVENPVSEQESVGIPEYWVVDVKGRQVWAFRLIDGKYYECDESLVLKGLPIDLIEQTLAQMDDDNGNVALWFADRIKSL
jgi:hypothetical protein